MIVMDPVEVTVQMKPPKQISTSGSQQNSKNKNIRLQYATEIQPRKIAHQLMAVRENLCQEAIEDIKSIRYSMI